MKRYWIPLLTLICLLSLTGCGDKGEIKEGMYYNATGISPDAILLTVNERDVAAERYFYWLNYNCEYTVEHLGKNPDWTEVRTIEEPESLAAAAPATGETSSAEEPSSTEEDKTEEKEEPVEQTLDEYVKQMALDNTALYSIVEEWAELYAITPTAEDKTAMAAAYQERCDAHGGESEYLAYLAAKGVSPALADSYSLDYYLYKGLYNLFLQEDSPLTPAEGAMEAFAQQQQLCSVDYIFISTEGLSGDPAALALRRERAQMVMDQLNADTNPPADFYQIMEAYSDRKDFPNGGFTFAPGESGMGEAFEAEAAKLGDLQYSRNVVEGPDGFYVLRGRTVDSGILSSMYFDQMLSDAVAAADVSVSRAYKKLSAAEFYTKMEELRAGGGSDEGSSSSEG